MPAQCARNSDVPSVCTQSPPPGDISHLDLAPAHYIAHITANVELNRSLNAISPYNQIYKIFVIYSFVSQKVHPCVDSSWILWIFIECIVHVHALPVLTGPPTPSLLHCLEPVLLTLTPCKHTESHPNPYMVLLIPLCKHFIIEVVYTAQGYIAQSALLEPHPAIWRYWQRNYLQ